MFDIDYTEIILLSCLGFFLIVQLVYFLVYLAKPLRYKDESIDELQAADLPPVSIIIAARNESQNLANFLPSVLEQNYPQYEVIVVNDGSTDESESVLGNLESQYPHLYRTYIPEGAKYLSRKKIAITVGVKAAKYDVLLYVEANSEPWNENWVRWMCRHFSDSKELVLGCNILSKSTSFLTKFAAYDCLFNSLKYISLALFHHPYRGVGRNLAYKKELFFTKKGFSKFLNLQAGEDDLFVNQVANSTNTAVELHSESITVTNLENFRMWKELRVCQATTQRYYKPGPVLFWRMETISRCLFYLSLGMSFFYGLFTGWMFSVLAITLYVIRMLTQILVINRFAKKIQSEFFYLTLPFFDLMQPFFDLYIFVCRIFRGRKDYTWR